MLWKTSCVPVLGRGAPFLARVPSTATTPALLPAHSLQPVEAIPAEMRGHMLGAIVDGMQAGRPGVVQKAASAAFYHSLDFVE